MTKDELKAAAVKKESFGLAFYPEENAFKSGFDAGYAAGQASAASPWVPINSEDDLPKVEGEYDVSTKDKVYKITCAVDETGPWWITSDYPRPEDIIAWRERPEPFAQPQTAEDAEGEEGVMSERVLLIEHCRGSDVEKEYTSREAKRDTFKVCRGCRDLIKIGQNYWDRGDVRYHDLCFRDSVEALRGIGDDNVGEFGQTSSHIYRALSNEDNAKLLNKVAKAVVPEARIHENNPLYDRMTSIHALLDTMAGTAGYLRSSELGPEGWGKVLDNYADRIPEEAVFLIHEALAHQQEWFRKRTALINDFLDSEPVAEILRKSEEMGQPTVRVFKDTPDIRGKLRDASLRGRLLKIAKKYEIEKSGDIRSTGLSRPVVEDAFNVAIKRAFAERTDFRIDSPGTASKDAKVDQASEDAPGRVSLGDFRFAVDPNNSSIRYSTPSETETAARERYRKIVDDVFAKKAPTNQTVKVSSEFRVLQGLGMSRRPIFMPAARFFKAAGQKHDVTQETIRRLPELLDDPIMVFKSTTADDSKVVVLDAMDAHGKPVVAAIHLDKSIGQFRVNFIASVYGKDAQGVFKKWIDDGDLEYANTKKLALWSPLHHLQLVGKVHSLKAKDRIKTEADFVNPPLRKVRTAIATSELETLAKSENFTEIIPKIKSSVSGNTLSLESAEAAEAVRTMLAVTEGTARAEQPILAGLFREPENVARLIDTAEGFIDAAEENGVDTTGLRKLVENLTSASKGNGSVKLKVFDEALPHEEVHEASWLGSGGKRFEQRYSNAKELRDDKNFQQFHKELNRQHGKTSHGAAMEEALAYLGTGDYERFGLNEDQSVDILAKLVTGYAEANGVESLKNFSKDSKIYEAIETGREVGSGERSDGRRGEVDQERETRPGPAESKSPANDPKEQTQKVAAFSRILGSDYYYDPQTHEQTEAKAQQLLSDVGTEQALWEALNGKPSPESMRVVYWELERLNGLADHYAETKQNAEYNAVANEIADLSSQIISRQVRAGQEIEIAKVLAPLSPEVALLTATRMKKYADGNPDATLTDTQSKQILNIAKELNQANKNLAAKELELKKAQRKIKRLQDDKEPVRRTPQARMLREYQQNKPDLIAKLKDAFPDAPVFNGRESALRMTAWHGSPHTFDKFSTEKIGTGEGAQAYGYGLYFTDREEIANHYRRANSGLGSDWASIDGGEPIRVSQLGKDPRLTKQEQYVIDAVFGDGDIVNGDVKKAVRDRVNWYTSLIESGLQSEENIGPMRDAAITLADRIDKAEPGAKYKVDLKPTEDEYLLWDVPFSEQSKKVQAALRKGSDTEAEWDIMGDRESSIQWDEKGHSIYRLISRRLPPAKPDDAFNDPAASEYFKSLGIRGIKFLDGNSRNASQEWIAKHPQGGENVFPSRADAEAYIKRNPEYKLIEPEPLNYNYVIFDDADVEIQEVLRSVPPSLDPDQAKLLTDYAAGMILEGRTYAEVLETLSAIVPTDVKAIHAKAVEMIRPSRPVSEETKERLKIRNEHYSKAEKYLAPDISGIAQDAKGRGKSDELVFTVDRLTGDKPKDLNGVVKDIREEFGSSLDEAVAIAKEANNLVRDIKADRRKQADEAREITPELRKELNDAKVAKARATYKLNKFLNQIANKPMLMERFNNDFRAKLVSNWGTQIFNAVQGVMSTGIESVIDLIETGVKTVANPNPDTTLDINAKDTFLPLAYVFANNKALSEYALSEFPEEYYRVHSGLMGDIDLEPRKLAEESPAITKPFHKYFDANERLNDWLSKVSGAKMQEMHFRSAIVASSLDQVIRKKSGGAATLKSAIDDGTLKTFITEKDAKLAVDKALRVTFASQINDPAGKLLKRGYDQLDKMLPVMLNPITFARFTYTTAKVMVANPLLLGALDTQTLGGEGYNSRSIAKGVLAWSGVAIAYGLLSAFGDDDDRWETVKIGENTFDVRRFFPMSAYFYLAHVIKGQVEGRPTPTPKELLAGFASLETEYFQYGAPVELATTLFDKAQGTKDWGDVGGSASRALGSYVSGITRFFKPMKDTLAQFDRDEVKMRDYSDSAKDKFLKEISKSLPAVGRLTEPTKDPATGEDVETKFPAGRMIGLNIVHPSFLGAKQTPATEWAERLFKYEGGGEMTEEQRKAFYIRRRLKNAVYRGDVKATELNDRIDSFVKQAKLTEKSANTLKKDLQLSELQFRLKYGYKPGPTGNPLMEKKLNKVLSVASDQEKEEARQVIGKRMR